MIIRHYQRKDLLRIKKQKEQVNEYIADNLYNSVDTITFCEGKEVLAIVRPFFEMGGRVYLSAVISVDCGGRKMLSLFRRFKAILDREIQKNDILRVEIVTQCGFLPAERLAFLLGFECEGTLKKYYNGMDFKIWARFK